MSVLRVDVSDALCQVAKGTVERLYRWLQDKIVKTCAIEKIIAIDGGHGATAGVS